MALVNGLIESLRIKIWYIALESEERFLLCFKNIVMSMKHGSNFC